jgi:hypothetical protein
MTSSKPTDRRIMPSTPPSLGARVKYAASRFAGARFPWWASLGFAKESFDIGGADTVVPAWQPYGFEFPVADPSVYGADGNMQDARDLSDSQQIFVA